MAVRILHRVTDSDRKLAFRSGDFEVDWNSDQSLGLVGWWPLGQGLNELDHVGVNHGVRVGTPAGTTTVASTRLGFGSLKTLRTERAGGSVAMPDELTGPRMEGLTVSIWVKTTVDQSEFLFRSGDGTIDFSILHGNFGRINFGVRNDSGSLVNAVSSFSGFDPLGFWSHWCGTWDLTTLRAYWQGIERATASLSGSNIFAGPGGGELSVSTERDSSKLEGLSSDFRVYDRSRPRGIVQQIFRKPWLLVLPRKRTFYLLPEAGAPPVGRVMSSLVAAGGLADAGGLAGSGGGLAG